MWDRWEPNLRTHVVRAIPERFRPEIRAWREEERTPAQEPEEVEEEEEQTSPVTVKAKAGEGTAARQAAEDLSAPPEPTEDSQEIKREES